MRPAAGKLQHKVWIKPHAHNSSIVVWEAQSYLTGAGRAGTDLPLTFLQFHRCADSGCIVVESLYNALSLHSQLESFYGYGAHVYAPYRQYCGPHLVCRLVEAVFQLMVARKHAWLTDTVKLMASGRRTKALDTLVALDQRSLVKHYETWGFTVSDTAYYERYMDALDTLLATGCTERSVTQEEQQKVEARYRIVLDEVAMHTTVSQLLQAVSQSPALLDLHLHPHSASHFTLHCMIHGPDACFPPHGRTTSL